MKLIQYPEYLVSTLDDDDLVHVRLQLLIG